MSITPTLSVPDNASVEAQLNQALIEEIQENGIQKMGTPEWFRPSDPDVAAATEGETMGLISDKRTSDRVTIYSTVDGEPRHILTYMLAKTIRKRRADGQPAFSLEPKMPYEQGSIPCMLNEKHPDRALWDEIGLKHRSCTMDGLSTRIDQQMHMQHRHKQEWQTIQDYRAELEREEERAFRREQMEFQRQLLADRAASQESPAQVATAKK